jgi:hypothetical protein
MKKTTQTGAGTSPRNFLGLEVRRREERELLAQIIAYLESLGKLRDETCVTSEYEDPIYRFYHQSFKVYYLQDSTERMVAALQKLAPHLPLNEWFMEIVQSGTGKEFALDDNKRWTAVTRPIIEAYFHARYFLEMVCKYSRELKSSPQPMPSGWAAVLYLYNIR